ncbi:MULTISPECIES: hypothetical protein [Kitasatospora]|uniref:AMP-binding enzyme C-terminal domain-containing protein n=1 Tax=Kitasatospora arboriphila TaxID=258052 RepID=A0ABN1TAP9_9ACTN
MTTPVPPHTSDDQLDEADLGTRLLSLERALTELPAARQTAVLIGELPDHGDVLLVAFVPADAEREESTQRAARAACARLVPALPALVIPVDDIPYTLDGELRGQQLFDEMLPQIARDLLLPKEMSA